MRPGADRGPQKGSEEVPGTLSCALYLLLAALSQSLGGELCQSHSGAVPMAECNRIGASMWDQPGTARQPALCAALGSPTATRLGDATCET